MRKLTSAPSLPRSPFPQMIGSLSILPFPVQAAVAPVAAAVEPVAVIEPVVIEPVAVPPPPVAPEAPEASSYVPLSTPFLNTEDICQQHEQVLIIGTAIMAAVLVSILVHAWLK